MCRLSCVRFLLLVLLCSATRLEAQNNAFGRSYTFTIPTLVDPNSAATPPGVYVRIRKVRAFSEGLVTISVPGTGYQQEIFFEPSHLASGGGVASSEWNILTEGRDEMVIIIDSEIDIVVHAGQNWHNREFNHGDAALIIPDHHLGTEYYIMSHNEDPQNHASEATVVATADNTYIDIIPTADTREWRAGEVNTILLNRGERYQIQSQGDLTGTYIGINQQLNTVCSPITVFGASTHSTVGPGTYPGYMFAQMLSIDKWGRSYSLVPFEADRNEYLVKVLAAEEGTTVSVNGVPRSQRINAGEYLTFTLDEAARIQGNKPIQVAQFFMGLASTNRLVDPFMLMTLADEQEFEDRGPSTNSVVLSSNVNDNILGETVIFREEDLPLFQGSQAFYDNIRPFAPNPEYVYSTTLGEEEVGIGLTLERNFLMYSYSYSKSNSDNNAGMRPNVGIPILDTLAIEIDPLAAVSPDRICLGDVPNFKADFRGKHGLRPAYDTFEWDFGDGNTASGDSVFHEYLLPGEYTVWLTANNGTALCSKEEITSTVITVVDNGPADISGPASVCPNVEGVTYSALGSSSNTYTWFISGGSLQTNTGQEVLVDWGDTNENAYLAVVSENVIGCVSDTMRYPVKINEQLEPGLPFGTTEVCGNDRTGMVYEVPQTPGSAYDWTVTGGAIVSGQGTHSITVDWDAPGANPLIGTVQFTESATTSTDVCDGTSPVLEVTIYTPLTFESEVTHVACFGGADGLVTITPSGGKAPYTLQWPDGDERLIREDLTAGLYNLQVTDSLGCVYSRVVVVEEPAELTAAVEVVPVSCHAGNDGQAYLNLSGGVAPYRVSWNQSAFNSSTDSLSLTAGVYHLQVLDANDCELLLNFEITEPTPLTATSTDTPSCPGESNGSILVEASGGTPPYTYRWNTSPPQDTQLISGLPAGIYSVTVFDANGCTFTFPNEEIVERLPRVHMPNAFSPNGDGHNDTFGAVTDCSLPFRMQIFSEWGTLAFVTDDISKGWDGTIKGEPAPNGKYSYIIFYTSTVNGVEINEAQRGTVRIFR